MRSINEAGENLIKTFESLRLTAYPDPSSPLGKECLSRKIDLTKYSDIDNWEDFSGTPWTIGWGHTGGVQPGDQISEEQAEEFFKADLTKFELGIEAAVSVELTDNQFAALVCFVFNVGLGNLTHGGQNGGPSTLLIKLNASEFEAAANEFLKWNKSHGQVIDGLTRRRLAEQKLFLTP